MANGKIEVYKMEWDRPRDPNHYTAHVGAFSQPEAIQHLNRRAGNNVNVTNLSRICEIDEFTPQVIGMLKEQVKQTSPELNSSVEDAILAEQKKLDNQGSKKVRGSVAK